MECPFYRENVKNIMTSTICSFSYDQRKERNTNMNFKKTLNIFKKLMFFIMGGVSIVALRYYAIFWPAVMFLIIALIAECVSLYLNVQKFLELRERRLLFIVVKNIFLIIPTILGLLIFKFGYDTLQKLISKL